MAMISLILPLTKASAVLCEKVPENPKGPYILVEDSLLALRQLATWYRMQLDIKGLALLEV